MSEDVAMRLLDTQSNNDNLASTIADETQNSEPKDDDDDEKEETRRAALELMVSLSEARPSLARRIDGWLPALVKACLEGVAELPDDEESQS